jgi:hypothetical protein
MKMNKPLPTLRRTKEQIDKDNAEFSNCGHCGKPLRKSKQRRDSPNGDSDREGKVTINPTFVNYGISPLSEVIKTSNYQYKNGSARDGYRYKRSE